MCRPSIYGHFLNGILLFIGIIYIILSRAQYDNKELGIIFVLLSIAIGVHALTHYFEEIFYDFNPLAGKWKIHRVTQEKAT